MRVNAGVFGVALVGPLLVWSAAVLGVSRLQFAGWVCVGTLAVFAVVLLRTRRR